MFLLALVWILGGCARPVADFTWKEAEWTAPAEVTFTNQSKKARSFVWTFGDGVSSEEANPRHVFLQSGEYPITLIARHGNKEVRVEKTLTVAAPEPCLVELLTPHGRMVIQLYDETPLHRDNFMRLVEEQFYDSLLFHRVIRGFMIQGGDPQSRRAPMETRLGSGGPGYQIDAEIRSAYIHQKGALCAARMGDGVNPQKKSSGSQFYLVQGNKASDNILDGVEARKGFRYTAEQREIYKTLGGTPHLDQDYTVFGQVIEGLEVIDRIAGMPTASGDRPQEDVWMSMRLIR